MNYAEQIDEEFKKLKEVEDTGKYVIGNTTYLINKYSQLVKVLVLLVKNDLERQSYYPMLSDDPIEIISDYFKIVKDNIKTIIPKYICENSNEISYWSQMPEDGSAIVYEHLYDTVLYFTIEYWKRLQGKETAPYAIGMLLSSVEDVRKSNKAKLNSIIN